MNETIGRTRCCRPERAMRSPPVIRKGRCTAAGTAKGPKRILKPDECLMDGCSRKPMDDFHLCRGCAGYYRRVCNICGHQITDEADRKTKGKLCLGCHYKHTKPGKAERNEMQRVRRLADAIRREREAQA